MINDRFCIVSSFWDYITVRCNHFGMTKIKCSHFGTTKKKCHHFGTTKKMLNLFKSLLGFGQSNFMANILKNKWTSIY